MVTTTIGPSHECHHHKAEIDGKSFVDFELCLQQLRFEAGWSVDKCYVVVTDRLEVNSWLCVREIYIQHNVNTHRPDDTSGTTSQLVAGTSGFSCDASESSSLAKSRAIKKIGRASCRDRECQYV